MTRALILTLALALLGLPMAASAAGSHDNNCLDCHSIHDTKGPFAFGVAPNSSEKYTESGQVVRSTDALCLGCHNEAEGIMPILLTKSHPVGLKPRKAFVPQEVLGKGGELTCTSCHDPHPSNPNYMYLRVGTQDGKRMGAFCSYCHEAMVDKNAL